MARKRKPAAAAEVKTTDYRHAGEKRTNIPPAKIASEGKIPQVPKVRYYYNPHLAPVLRFDSTGEADGVKGLLNEAGRRVLQPQEVRMVREAINQYEPWLEWAGKREQHEKGHFEVDPVALHIHERVSAKAIVRTATREDVQREFFADPQQPYQEAIQFYRHHVDWANRLILGESLHVMSSLGRRENLAGKVQMIYMDPPYGIKFASNFQPLVAERQVGESERDLTREPETVRAYRDTWSLGVHSYLAYLRDRFVLARELLTDEGSLFVQISDEHLHRVRSVLDEVFGPGSYVTTISFVRAGTQTSRFLPTTGDYVLWYAKRIERLKYHPLYVADGGWVARAEDQWIELPGGERTRIRDGESAPTGALRFTHNKLESASGSEASQFVVRLEGSELSPRRGWSTNPLGMERLRQSERLLLLGKSLRRIVRHDDFPLSKLSSTWRDTYVSGFASDKRFVVETPPLVVHRCMAMTTKPGDLVLDPTCGGGTTAYVAETLGRRWIAIDTSRVAIALTRQRLLTARLDWYATEASLQDGSADPGRGLRYERVPRIEMRTIVQNNNLDPILAKHEPILGATLATCNTALRQVTPELRRKLAAKLKLKPKREQTDADRRRWDLPEKFEDWMVPFDTDPDWPQELQGAVMAYRMARQGKMNEVNACIADNAEPVDLVDQPRVVSGVLRVSGPFTVEGVRPEELSVGEEGLFEATPAGLEDDDAPVELQNFNAYLTHLVQHLRADGLTFVGNNQRKFTRLEPLIEAQTGTIVHAEGVWEGGDLNGPNSVAVGFGPQYGPVTAQQVEELIRAAKRYDDVVVAGFSFDAEATEVIQAQGHQKLRIHQAYIRPDINPGMEGLLKDTPNSQLFTVFGQPEVEVERTKDEEWVARLAGVDIYDPIENTVRSSGAEKVAAWFLDSDYDGRCFCITQAFFPNQDAWERIAKALGSNADAEAFEKFSGTESLPFKTGKYKRIAVKVIDPRGNEVIAVRQLEA